MSDNLLEIRDLEIHFWSGGQEVRTLHGVDLDIGRGQIVGLVGESGSGKTITALALMGLLDTRSSRVSGTALLDGQPLELVRPRRGRGAVSAVSPLAMIFQEPMTALDPVFTVGSQIVETLKCRQGVTGPAARTQALDLLDQVGIADPAARMRSYPHQMSGGMRQRAMIAIALACAPKLLIADEPTTAVDVTIQAQLLDLIKNLAAERDMSVLFITHDLGVVAETCDDMVTMYAGEVVEQGPVSEVLDHPAHPYTAGLLAALPSPTSRGSRLASIPGRVPPPGSNVTGCVFADRCAHTTPECRESALELRPITEQRVVRCRRAEALHLTGVRS